MKPIWGVDLGGTKIEGAILEHSNSTNTLVRLRVPTERDLGYEHILNQINDLIISMKKASGLKPEAIGFATPGALDPATQTLKNSNTVCLNGQAFKRDIEKKLGLPIAMANDANCFAVAEAKLGIVQDEIPNAEVVFGVIMGTGVGGGVVVNGKVINGRHGIGGEWGHNFLDESGGSCYCGRTGCTETIISGPALEQFYEKLSGKQHSLKEIIQLYKEQKDEVAQITVERLIHFFGKGIASIINVLDPDAIVLGGGLGNIDLLYKEGPKAVEKYLFNPRLDTLFLKPKLGDSAGVFGAALLVS